MITVSPEEVKQLFYNLSAWRVYPGEQGYKERDAFYTQLRAILAKIEEDKDEVLL